LLHYAREPQRRLEHGRQARERAVREYSLRRMLADYENLYRLHSGLTLEAA
jgi:glycosyltransferase involved in cell wall biosynthesis